MSGRSVILPTLFLGRLRPPKRLTSTSCTYFRQLLTTGLLESAEGETKVCGRTGYPTRDLWLISQTRYRLRYATRLFLLLIKFPYLKFFLVPLFVAFSPEWMRLRILPYVFSCSMSRIVSMLAETCLAVELLGSNGRRSYSYKNAHQSHLMVKVRVKTYKTKTTVK